MSQRRERRQAGLLMETGSAPRAAVMKSMKRWFPPAVIAIAVIGPAALRSWRGVTNVTWFEAQAYCGWLTKKFGRGRWFFSLPSEAEWEKAARGPDGFDFALSRSFSDGEVNLYNWKKNPGAEVTVVGAGASQTSYLPNRYGIYHLSGNVVEWTSSVARPFNRERPYVDAERDREDINETRVARGGSWYSASIALLYIAYRDSFQPEVSHHDLGFRIVARPLP